MDPPSAGSEGAPLLLSAVEVLQAIFNQLLAKLQCCLDFAGTGAPTVVLIQNVCITYGYIKKMEENPHPRPTTPVVEEVVPRPLVGPVHPPIHLLYAGTKGGMGARDMDALPFTSTPTTTCI